MNTEAVPFSSGHGAVCRSVVNGNERFITNKAEVPK
jgi:hypothetical protein